MSSHDNKTAAICGMKGANMAKKKLNTRCPLQSECERKCTCEGHELECDYYANNAVGDGRIIEDQELIRAERERVVYEAEYEAELACVDEEEPSEPVSSGHLQYIDINELYPHPDNPRKDVGDVSELAESIKAKGVLQNLTVVPGHYLSPQEWSRLCAEYEKAPSEELRVVMNKRWVNNGYTVIIGHRRLAGSKLAGMSVLPCSVVEMSLEDQVATMLVENIQRSDLTVYEEAKGFQMMLDLGKTVKEVSEMSGFSESTVRKRVKLAELDEAKFKKAVDRGATLFDFAELDKIEDPAIKDKLLGSMGKADFKNELRRALHEQTQKKKIETYVEQVSGWATRIEKVTWEKSSRYAEVDCEKVEVKYLRNYGYWTTENTSAVEHPEGCDGRRLFFTASSREVDVYVEITDEDRKANAQREAEKQRKIDKSEARESKFVEISTRHYDLRKEFILSFNQYKQKSAEVAEFISETMMMCGLSDRYHSEDIETLAELLGISLNEEEDNLDYHEFLRLKKEQPERTMLIIAFWLRDNEDERYWWRKCDSSISEYRIIYNENGTLDDTYRLLTWLGYEVSTEEKEMRNGTHKLFETEDNDEEDCEEESEDE